MVQHPFSLKMNVSEELATSGAASALLTSNYSLTRNGVSFPINAAEFSLNTATSKYEAELFLATDLTDGRYVVTARQTLTDLSGNQLDGNLNGAPGGNFARAFTIAVPAAVGPEFRANFTTASIQTSSAVAAAANGDFVIAWQRSGQDGSGYSIYAQRYNAIGQPQGGEFLVNTFTATNQLDPSIAMDANGDFVITWRSDSHDGSGFGIFAQRYNASGVPQGAEFRANTFTTGSQIDPEISMDAAGDFVIVWASSGQDASHYGVYAQRYNALGDAQGAEFRVNTFTTNEQSEPAVAMDADGDFVVAWESFGQDAAGSFGIFAQRYSAAGTRQGAEFPVNNHTANHQRNCAIAMDAEGDFVVTWESLQQIGAGYNLYVRRFAAAGMPLTPEFLANANLTNNARRPSIAIDSDGDFVIAWEATADNTIYANLFNATGESISVEFRVNTFTPGQHTLAAAAIDADGDFVISWTSPQQDGSSSGVYAQRYGSVLAPLVSAPTFLFQSDPHRIRYTFDQNVSASLAVNDLLLENLPTSQTIPSSDISLSYNTTTNLATFSYIGPGASIPGVLPDGDYRATLVASGITSANGIPLPANHVFNFFFLNGDAHRDHTVNLTDFNTLASNFGTGGRNFSQGNFDYDPAGNVNLADFNILAARFGASLARPAAFAHQRIAPARSTDELREWLEELS